MKLWSVLLAATVGGTCTIDVASAREVLAATAAPSAETFESAATHSSAMPWRAWPRSTSVIGGAAPVVLPPVMPARITVAPVPRRESSARPAPAAPHDERAAARDDVETPRTQAMLLALAALGLMLAMRHGGSRTTG